VIEGLKYMPSHEWTKVDGDVATVGITDHAQVRSRTRDPSWGPLLIARERDANDARERGGAKRTRRE
jgi:hypothetical protein